MSVEKDVAAHYTHGRLGEVILRRLERAGGVSSDRMAGLDEFHIGGRAATAHLMGQMNIAPGMQVLDVGSGIGGAARFAADKYGVLVTGIDLTPEYRGVAEMLSEKLGLWGKTRFVTGNALEMPFADRAFDAAYTIHVSMNISGKERLYREIARVLKPGALLGVYDVLAGPEPGDFSFPVPWAETAETSFLASPEGMKEMIVAAGFDILSVEDRRDFALSALGKLQGVLPDNGPVVMGENFPVKIGNLIRNIEAGLCAPWQIIGRMQG